ncbi:MAG: hypothetical protein PHD15_00505 [Clostridia bacterium]|nr:hypothetical protein [Clostridia bacterium]MDD4386232.1 hypothetical protein [Clostridia bacterium]
MFKNPYYCDDNNTSTNCCSRDSDSDIANSNDSANNNYFSKDYDLDNYHYKQSKLYVNMQELFCLCAGKVLCFLSSLLAFTVGLILGAIFSEILLLSLSSIIVFAVVLIILIITLLIFTHCNCCKYRKCG